MQNSVEALRNQLQRLEEAVPLSAISSDDSALASPCVSPTKSTTAPAMTAAAATPPHDASPARLQTPPDAAHRDPFSNRPPSSSMSAGPAAPDTHLPGAPTLTATSSASVAANLSSNRLIAARTAHAALVGMPPWLAALGRSAQVYSHAGHAVTLQRSLYDCPANVAAVQDAITEHKVRKERLTELLHHRRCVEALRQASLVEEYVDRYCSHVKQASFAEVNLPPPQHLRFGLALWRPQDDLELVDEHCNNFSCPMPQQISPEAADKDLFKDRSRLVLDPVAAMQVCRLGWKCNQFWFTFGCLVASPHVVYHMLLTGIAV
jgi:hypothetical protein